MYCINKNIFILIIAIILFILLVIKLIANKNKKSAQLKQKQNYLNFYKAIEQEFREKAEAKQNGQ